MIKMFLKKIKHYIVRALLWAYVKYDLLVLYCKKFKWTQKNFWKAIGIIIILFMFFINIIKHGSIYTGIVYTILWLLVFTGLGALLCLAIIFSETLPKE